MNPVFAVQSAERVFRVRDFRAISPELVEFSLNSSYWLPARWAGKCYQSEGPQSDNYVLSGPDFRPIQKIPDWRPEGHRLDKWTVTDRNGTRRLDKSRPPENKCELSIKTADGKPAASIVVNGSRTHYRIERGGWPSLIGERIWHPLASVIATVEEEWDRWWLQEQEREQEDDHE